MDSPADWIVIGFVCAVICLIMSRVLDFLKINNKKSVCKCGKYRKCKVKVRIEGPGILVVDSNTLLQCGNVLKQIDMCKSIRTKLKEDK